MILSFRPPRDSIVGVLCCTEPLIPWGPFSQLLILMPMLLGSYAEDP